MTDPDDRTAPPTRLTVPPGYDPDGPPNSPAWDELDGHDAGEDDGTDHSASS